MTIRRENREIADHLEYIRTTVDTIQKPSAEEEMRKAEEEQRKLAEERKAYDKAKKDKKNKNKKG